MKRTSWIPVALLLTVAGPLVAHDLFLVLGSHFVAPNSTAEIRVMNGTFTQSESAVARSRLSDLSVVSGGRRRTLDTASWTPRENDALLRVQVGEEGTYVVGASLTPNQITIDGKNFTGYLREEGLSAILRDRAQRNKTGEPARERYAKHVKVLVQVGNARSMDFSARLGYPAELVPVNNPYSLRVGQTLRVLSLVDGRQSGGETVIAGGRTRSGARIPRQTATADANGLARIRLTHRGRWYVKFIHMEPVASDSIDYESKWATLTFEVR